MGNHAQCWLICFFLFGSIAQAYSQSVNFEDGFEDGDFTNNPTWTGDTTFYSITLEGQNSLLQLQGNSASGGTDYLSTASVDSLGSWEFYIQLDFSPSGGNKADIFLMSNIANLEGPVNGYALRAGESGSDDVFRIVRYDSGTEGPIVLSGTTDISNGSAFRVKVTRQSGGIWTLEVAKGYDGILSQEGGSQTEATYTSTNYFGVRSTYTSSRADLFYYDFKIDLPPLTITDAAARGDSIWVTFNRRFDQSSIQAGDFTINQGLGMPSSVDVSSPNRVRLFYNNALGSGHYEVTAQNIQDLQGAPIADGSTTSFIVFGVPEPGDLILNEFMYDPPTGLPEYVEVRNTSDNYLNLQHWQMGDESDTTVVSEDTLAIAPHSYLVVAPDTLGLSTTFGDRTYVQADLPSFNNTGDAVKLLTNLGVLADSLYYQPSWGGNKVALERRTATVAERYRENWANSPASDSGTPGAPNQVAADIQPPDLRSMKILSDLNLQLLFDERLDSSATNPDHYHLPGIDINTSTFISPGTVKLALNTPLQNARPYQLDLSGLQDIFGNSITSIDTTFTYYKISPVDSGDVVINECMYDPPSGTTEYIELYNSSDKTLDLNGWTINDNTGNQNSITYQQYLLPPDSLIILAPDSSLSASDLRISLISMGSRFPSLNNSGDGISLRDSSGTKLDSLQYSAGWGGQALALERRSPTLGAGYASNWGEAPNGFGTPGKPNNIGADEIPPQIEQFGITAPDSLQLILSEYPDEASAETNAHYSISGTPSIASAHFHPPDTVTIALSETLQNNTTYTFALEGLPDLFGNAAMAVDTTFTYYKVSPVDSSNVFISEFLFDPPEGRGEYIELYNATQQSFNLKQWTFNDNTGSPRTITDERYILAPDDYVVIATDRSLASQNNDLPLITMGSRFPSLNNSGDDIVLRDSSGLLLDSLRYTDSWSTSGQASERRSYELSAVYKANWGPPADSTGSPGTANTVAPDTQPPKLIALSISNDRSVQLIFDEYLSSPSTQGTFSVSGDPQISGKEFNAPDTVRLSLSQPLENAETYTISIADVQDLFGNAMAQSDTSFTFYQPVPVDSGQVVVNEFRAEPSPGHTEYIELYNPTAHSFDLGNWTINDNRGNPVPVTNASYILPPQSFVVIAPDNSLLSDHPDIRLLTMDQFPALNNSGDDIVLRDARGLLLDSLRYISSWRTDSTAFERRSASVPGTYAENWESSPAVAGGTPGLPNVVEPDAQPPALKTFTILGAQELRLIFDERIADVAQYGAFNISDPLQISDQNLAAPDTVFLQLSDPLQNATQYRLSVSEVQDVFGNQSVSADTLFTYYQPSKADSGQVFINEFSYNPAAGKAEYIELYNPTEYAFDLRGWTLSDNRGTPNVIIMESYILPPNSYVVLSPDNSLLKTTPDLPLIAMGSHFPALNNSGDDIVVKNKSGLPIDSLRFTSAWGSNEMPLERKAISIPGFFSENWSNAPTLSGTPGTDNQVAADQEAPKLKHINITSNTEIQLIFSERLLPGSTLNRSNYTISPSRNIQLIATQADTVSLFLAQPLVSDQEYLLTLSGIRDIFGNKRPEDQHKIEFIKLSGATPGDIVLNEIMSNPGPASVEFIEIYNRSEKNIDLGNWPISDASSRAVLPAGSLLKAGQYLILTGNPTFAQSKPQAVSVPGFPSLNNTADALTLQTASGALIDSLRYNKQWNITGRAASLERKDPRAASGDASNWTINNTSVGHSAGTKNSSFQPDNIPPDALFAKIRADGTIAVHFTEFIQQNDSLQFLLDGTPLAQQSFDPKKGNRIILQNTAPTGGSITIRNLRDVRGNLTTSTQIPLAHPLRQGDLVINEIMFNPLNDADDNKANQSEYAELYNTRSHAISLEGLVLHDAPDEDGNFRTLRLVTRTAKWVGPGETVLIYPSETTVFTQSKVARFFTVDTTQMRSILRVERDGLSLASSGDALFISDSSGATIDSVFYDESWHNPNLLDTKGIALERISPKGASNAPANWGSSVHPKGGTPLAQNSLYQQQPKQPAKVGISFAPNPFSPDGDGYEDNLVISYTLDQADYLLRINIFDRYGRHIKELADGKPAGFEGSLIWDGRRDDGRRNRIGIYIIVFEAYDSTSGSDKAFKKTVVIARKLN